MKSNKLILTLTLSMLGITTASFAAIGDVVKDVAAVPGKVVRGTGEVVKDVAQVPGEVIKGTGEVVTKTGEAITPRRTTTKETIGETIVQAPGEIVKGTGKAISTVGEAITPKKHKKAVTEEAQPTFTCEVCEACPSCPCPVCDSNH